MANESPKIRDDYDRQRGIFTPRDRRFLAGLLDDELSDNDKRQKRYRLRQRMVHALQDLAYLSVMDTQDVGQVAEAFTLDMGLPEYIRSEEKAAVRRQTLMRHAAETLIEFIRELYGLETIEHILQRQVATAKALDFYHETGQYAKFEVSVEVTQGEPMEIGRLASYAADRKQVYEEGLYGAAEILDLEGVELPRYQPEHPNLWPRVKEIADELAGDDETAEIENVLATVSTREGVSREVAKEAYLDMLFMGDAYEPTADTVKTIL
jgi:hypothetical protein